MTSEKTPGYCGSSVYDPEGRGVALVVHVVAEGVKEPDHVICARLYPRKQAEGTVFILSSDKHGNTWSADLLLCAAKLQYGGDAVKAVAKAAKVHIDNVTYMSLGGGRCFATSSYSGSPRTGTSHTQRQKDHVPHR